MYNLVILRFSATYADDSSRHCFQRIHGWRITVELIEYGIASIHHFYIFSKRDIFGYPKLRLVWIFLSYGLCCLQHDIGTLVFASAFVDSDEELYLLGDI